jgi:hypothetical protein
MQRQPTIVDHGATAAACRLAAGVTCTCSPLLRLAAPLIAPRFRSSCPGAGLRRLALAFLALSLFPIELFCAPPALKLPVAQLPAAAAGVLQPPRGLARLFAVAPLQRRSALWARRTRLRPPLPLLLAARRLTLLLLPLLLAARRHTLLPLLLLLLLLCLGAFLAYVQRAVVVLLWAAGLRRHTLLGAWCRHWHPAAIHRRQACGPR